MAPLPVFWDWSTGSRLLATYGTHEAHTLSKRCVLVKVVEEWKMKVKANKARSVSGAISLFCAEADYSQPTQRLGLFIRS